MIDRKDTNPKDALGISKCPISAIPSVALTYTGLAMMEGALKYGRHNYRESGVRLSVYYDAMMRHMMAFYEGEDIDPDSGLPHTAKAAACLCIIMDSMHRGMCVDDRPPAMEIGWMKEMNELASELRNRYPDPEPPVTEKNKTND